MTSPAILLGAAIKARSHAAAAKWSAPRCEQRKTVLLVSPGALVAVSMNFLCTIGASTNAAGRLVQATGVMDTIDCQGDVGGLGWPGQHHLR